MRSKTYIATPPGATIREQLADRGMNQKDFALRMDMSEKHISHLINGDVALTADVAMRLEMVLGLPASFWNNLESIYREKLLKVEAENSMDQDIEIAKKIPYSEMANHGWVDVTRNSIEKVINLRKYFEVVNLNLLSSIPGILCRKLGEGKKSDYAMLAWAQKAKLEARKVAVKSINLEKLKGYIPEIRKMTTQDPEKFCNVLCDMLSECGIALIFLPHIGGSFLHGATFYDGPKIVIGMTVRGKDADKFWFSFFHEIGHIVLGHINKYEGTIGSDESSANDFAENVLISKSDYNKFLERKMFDKESIVSFAKSIGIDPGIVLGRLQKDKYLDFTVYQELKTKYAIN